MNELKEPPIGSVFYEIGWKREEPCSPIVITRVYCGRAKDPSMHPDAPEYYMAAEFSTWWNVTVAWKTPIEPRHCLKYRSLEDMLASLKTWEEVYEWIIKEGKNWRDSMNQRTDSAGFFTSSSDPQ